MTKALSRILSLAAIAAWSQASLAQTAPGGAATNRPAPHRYGSFARGADQPAPRTDKTSQIAHEQLVAKAKRGGVDIYFEGDSITRRWGTSDYQWRANLENWKSNFFGWNAGDFGWGADLKLNILWRLENGDLDGVYPNSIARRKCINSGRTH